MIPIDRKKVAVPTVLSGENSRGVKETKKAIEYYKNGLPEKPFSYSIYRHSEVKQILIDLFMGKCAYCESKFLAVYSGDVEHFRPKGEITEANPSKPGYYWLAADWDNLLLSCRNCNQKLTHEIQGLAKKQTMGKMNQFPLADEDKRARSHKEKLDTEETYRLLLDPCRENPEEHLEYDTTHAIIKPKKMADGKVSEKGARSIEVYVLQRVPLVLAREKVLIQILAQIQRVKDAVKNVNDHTDERFSVQVYYDKILKQELKYLYQYMQPAEEYSAMAKQVIKKFLNESFGITS